MFTQISWTDYLLAVSILLAIYYLFVGVRYFSGDLKALLAGKRKLTLKTSGFPQSEPLQTEVSEDISVTTDEDSDDEFAEVEHLIEKVKAMIADALGKQLVKEEFRQYLRLVLKEFPSVKTSVLRPSVNELIVSECEKQGIGAFNEDEVDALWSDER
ncbi:hypothetical protein Q763_09710 [Flavobacterium beibuense F44-8]|uniref:Uncharacterized protein n=1 Tax=Flavobacterium beibuense F44-8 TaxID=1406840 RepID=A0A0A2LKM3_9FLAO|nr:hypothetical protein [Flavobacterium beibuense]KGO80802.1 hypothetical protein Q763_09710 [Flavobacterium beibuense F44-8]